MFFAATLRSAAGAFPRLPNNNRIGMASGTSACKYQTRLNQRGPEGNHLILYFNIICDNVNRSVGIICNQFLVRPGAKQPDIVDGRLVGRMSRTQAVDKENCLTLGRNQNKHRRL